MLHDPTLQRLCFACVVSKKCSQWTKIYYSNKRSCNREQILCTKILVV